ncbi:MAG: aminotransferase class I/II-fold pyridoxal phosphate-dependent enzyme [Myxococcota bacterium]
MLRAASAECKAQPDFDMNSTSPSQPIAVVGVGCRFPDAQDVQQFWHNIERGHVSFRDVPRDRWNHEFFFSPNQREVDKTWAPKGSFLDGYRSFAAMHYGIAPRRLDVMDPQQRLLIEATRWAIQDAGYETRGFDRRRTGVFVGVSVSEFKNIAQARIHALQMVAGDYGGAADESLRDLFMGLTSNVAPMRAFTLSGSLTALNAAAVAQVFDLGGPAYTIDSACASASVAIHNAVALLRAGALDQAVAGGVYLNLTPDNLVAFTKIGAISPSGFCRPFDARADGFVQSDGVGVVFLKRLTDALADGDRIHAIIAGSGCNNDGRGEGPMTPRFEGQVEVLRAAYEDAGISPASVKYIEAHGTATNIGDPVEVKALGHILSEAKVDGVVHIGSVKANIGHAMAAAGIAGFIKAINVLRTRRLAPQPDFGEVHPNLDLHRHPLEVAKNDIVLAGAEEPLRVGVSSFGFGGTNSHIVLEAPATPAAKRERVPELGGEPGCIGPAPQWPEAIIVTAGSTELLAKYCSDLASHFAEGAGRDARLADIAFTLNAHRRLETVRAVVCARTRDQFLQQLYELSRVLRDQRISLPLVVSPHVQVVEFDPRKNAAPTLCFLYPGQGAQRLNLLRDLHRRCPFFAERFAVYQHACADLLEKPLGAYLYPELEGDDESEDRLEDLTRTDVCQPAMAALSMALTDFLNHLGVRADVSLGHSLGEFCALAEAGALTRESAVRAVAERGRAMAELHLDDPGAMAAVMAEVEVVRDVVDDENVVLANINHPRQCVLSGRTSAVDRAIEVLKNRGLDVRPLKVSHAFHSPLMRGIDERMQAVLEALELGPTRHIVASCVDAEVYNADGDRTRRILVNHASRSVHFVRGLEQAWEAGARAFVQLGAGSMLLGFARATLGKDVVMVATAATEPDGGFELSRGLCQLAIRGVPVDFFAFYESEQRQLLTLPETPLIREEYWPVKESPQPLSQITAPVPTKGVRVVSSPSGPSPSTTGSTTGVPGLVELFREQVRLLQHQAEIMNSQAEALTKVLGEQPSTPKAPHENQPLEAVAESVSAATPTQEGTHVEGPRSAGPEQPQREANAVREKVFELVAKVSAFPPDSLRPDQRLVDELGFDSLMVADLGGAIDKAFPNAGGLPQSLFSLQTTVDDVANHLVATIAREPQPHEPQRDDSTSSPSREAERSQANEGRTSLGQSTTAPEDTARSRAVAARYEVVPRDRPRPVGTPHDVADEVWLVTEDDSRLATEITDGLRRRGARVVAIRFTRNAAVPDRLTTQGVNLWPEPYVEGLPQCLESSGLTPDGFIHAAGLETAEAVAYDRALSALHALASRLSAPRIAVLTALGGRLGLERGPLLTRNLVQAALAGYTKALARERPRDAIKTVDLDPGASATANASFVLDEILSGARDLEVGSADGRRLTPALVPAGPARRKRAIGPHDVVLVTGGAGDIGSKVALRLAAKGPRGVVLAGRRPADDHINDLLAALSRAGTTAVYIQADVTDAEQLRDATQVLERRLGPITVVVHSAGVIDDAPATRKTFESIQHVMDVKVRATQAILHAFPELKDLVLFTSWSGRFGNAGQVDYAAANDLLDRLAVSGLGSTRTVAIAWPPWRDTAMVRAIPLTVQRAMEGSGVTFLEAEEGLDLFEEILDGDVAGIQLIGRNMDREVLRFVDRRRFTLAGHPYLDDHRLKGRAVVPLAVVLDWVMGAVRDAQGNDGPWALDGFELVRGIHEGDEAELELEGRVDGEGRPQAQIQVYLVKKDGGRHLAYRGHASTSVVSAASVSIEPKGSERPVGFGLEAFYERFTFHGPRFRAIKAVHRVVEGGISGRVRGSARRVWMPETPGTWTVDPLVVDAAFQLAGYWTSLVMGRTGFPIRVQRMVLHSPIEPASDSEARDEDVEARVHLVEQSGDRFVGDVFLMTPTGKLLASLHGVEGRFAAVRVDHPDDQPQPNGSLIQDKAPAKSEASSPAGNGHSTASNGKPTVSFDADAIRPETYDVSLFPELEALDQRFEMARLMGLKNPYFQAHLGTARDTSNVEGVEMINFSSYNYLGFSGHPEVVEAAQRAVESYGTSVSASRVASGERPIHRELEKGIARHIGVQDALVFVSGHATNVTTVGHLLNKDDLVLHDSLIHDSVLQGIYLSGATRRPFPHNDVDAAERALSQIRRNFRRVLVVAEGIYSMDGDTCDLSRLIQLKKTFKTLLMVDEAHSIGVLGPSGRGIGHHGSPAVDVNDVDIWMGTLSKSFASCGGYIAGSSSLIRYLKYTAPGFVYSAGLPPSNAAAALKALELMHQHPEVVERLRQRSKFFLELLRERNINTGDAIGAAVVPAIIGNSMECLKLSEALAARRINVQPIVYPAVEDDAARLRFFISATHSEIQLRQTADALVEELGRLRGEIGQPALSM